MVRYHRMFALVLAFVMAFTLAVTPARNVSAESDSSNSLEVNIDAGGTAFNGKLYLDMVNDVLAAVGSMGYNGQTMLNAVVYLDVSEAGPALVASGTPFLDQAYGVDLRNLTKNLPGSVFAPDSGSKLAMDQETYDRFMGELGTQFSQVVETAPARAELAEQVMGTLMPHLETYMNTLMQNAQISAGPKTLSLPTGDVKTTSSTVTVTGEVIAESISTLLNSLSGDAEVRAALAQCYDEMVSSGAFTPSSELEGVTGKEFFDTLFQNKDEFCQDFAQAMTEKKMTLTGSAAIDQQTEELVGIGLEMAADGETVSLELVFANGTYYLDVSDNGVHSKIIFCIQKNTESLLVATLAVTEDDAETARIAFTWDKDAGTYEVTAADGSNVHTMTGTITSDDTSTTITFDALDGQSMGNTFIKLSSSDPITFPSYKEILTMTEEEILQVVQKFTGIVDQMSE